MRESLFSPLWYRVAEKHPHLRPEVRVQRQTVREQRWYLLVNPTNGRQFRVNAEAWAFIGRCNGALTVGEVWNALLDQYRDDAPTQNDVIQLLNQLDEHELIAYEHAADAATLARRRGERVKAKVQGFVNPFAMRVPLGDPSAFLRRLDALPRRLFSRATAVLWLVAMVVAFVAAGSHWDSLSAHARTYMGTPRYLLLAWLVFPLLKALHELAHALAVRRWGGTVGGMGFSLFVLVPAPYVDASAAAAFRSRWQRVIVGAAGMMVELVVAALALAVWLNVQPGIVADLAFVTMFIASVTTLVFNGNPLLPFDAYFIACDVFDVPNLGPRSRTWWTRALTRLMGGRKAGELMTLSRGEGKWLVAYAPLSLVYRLVLSVGIIVWLGAHSTLLAVAGGVALAFSTVAKPLYGLAQRIREMLPPGGARRRAALVGTGGAAALLVAVCAVPLPFHTVASGVVWPSDHARVRPGVDGFIAEILVRDGDRVKAGEVLVVLDDPALYVERERLSNRLEQLEADRYSALTSSPEQAKNAEEELARVHGDLARVEDKIAQLEVRAQADGVLVMPQQQDLPGTYVKKGSTVAYVLEKAEIAVRAALPEYDAAFLRGGTRGIEVRLAGDDETLPAKLVRDIPAATHELPSAALGDKGGGPHATDPADTAGMKTQDPIVLVDVALPATRIDRVGSRAWVRFDHGATPLAARWYRQARQVLLQHFNPAG
jgi:putative peptide zinc metalloprotease protein